MVDLGSKFECAECGTKFYDLGNPAAACPKCGAAPGRDRGESERKPSPARVPEVVDDDDAPEVEDAADDAATDVLEDDAEEDDDDDEE